jgi:hypothetical protein
MIAMVLVVVLFAVLVVNNNYSFHRTSRAEFSSRMDRAMESATQWIVAHPAIQGNPSVMYMIGDMAQMSGDPRLRQYVDSYLASKWVRVDGHPVTWYYARLAEPTLPVPLLLAEETPRGEIGWDAYAAAPDRLQNGAAIRADLFSTDKYIWGLRNHQLLALDIYRRFNGPSPELDAVMNKVVEGVARDAYWDFRVSDSYEQRSAFLLDAGRPDLVRSRWIERVLENQQADGAWNYCWFGWCRGVFEFRLNGGDQGHSTVQAAWALYQLKYRYPEWIKEHYQ